METRRRSCGEEVCFDLDHDGLAVQEPAVAVEYQKAVDMALLH